MRNEIMNGKYLATLNRNNDVELTGPEGARAIIDEAKGYIYFDCGKKIMLSMKDAEEVKMFKTSLRQELVEYYNRLLTGKERIMLIPTNDPKDYTYVITSESLLESGYKSEKYGEVLESVFYPKSLENVRKNYKIRKEDWVKDGLFNGFHDVHLKVGKLNFPDGVATLTVKELIDKTNRLFQ